MGLNNLRDSRARNSSLEQPSSSLRLGARTSYIAETVL